VARLPQCWHAGNQTGGTELNAPLNKNAVGSKIGPFSVFHY